MHLDFKTLEPTIENLSLSRDLRIGYWNINKRKTEEIESYISDFLAEKNLDVLLLSEYEDFTPASILGSKYKIVGPGPTCKKVLTISKKCIDFQIATDSERFVLLTSEKYRCALVGLHLRDNVYGNNQSVERHETLAEILEGLGSTKKDNHILVGDFNCLPTDWEMTDSSGLHAVLFKEELKNSGGESPKHYNPTLLLLSEHGPTYGSVRYTKDRFRLYWYAYDQVVVSKSLADSISDIEYLRSINGKSLMSSIGVAPFVSDHLPLVFVIKELRNEQ